MIRQRIALLLAGLALALPAGAATADTSFAGVAEEVNKKMVKLFGSGGFRGLASYGTGIFISNDGYILTAASHILDTQDLRVHLYDGRRYHAKVVVTEPELDIALVQLDLKKDEKLDDLPFFDFLAAAKKPLVDAGTGILAFSNQFQIATRDEPMSVQRGVIAAYTKLQGSKGIFKAPYTGHVYVLDAITNNPGAAGGVVTTRKGELLGIIGKELQNELTSTWMNYAVPVQAVAEVVDAENNKRTVSIAEIVEKKEKYIPIKKLDATVKADNYHGLILVPDVVERTPPYVEEIDPNSPAAKAGFKPDDLVVYIQGEQINNIKAFKEIMGKVRPQTQLQVEVRRGDKLTTLTLSWASL